MNFQDRCNIAAACLPRADYRAKLEALHAEMLAALAPVVAHACAASAVVDHKPLTDDRLAEMRRASRLDFVTLREFIIVARAIEAAHAIPAAPESTMQRMQRLRAEYEAALAAHDAECDAATGAAA